MNQLSGYAGLRAIFFILALTWLPSGALHCLGMPDARGDCHALRTVASSHHHSSGTHHAAPPARRSGNGGGSECCPVMSQCDTGAVAAASASGQLQPLAALSTLVTGVSIPRLALEDRTPIRVAHGPPTYLRNATLRI